MKREKKIVQRKKSTFRFLEEVVVNILLSGVLLLFFGIFAIYSVSIHESFKLTLKHVTKGLRNDPSNYYYFREQMSKFGMGIVSSLVIYMIPLKFFKKGKYIIFILGFLFVCLLFTKLGTDFGKGQTLWIRFSGLTIQPGEFYKIGYVLFLAGWLERKRKIMKGLSFYLSFLIMVGVGSVLFLLLHDGGTLLVLGSTALVMFWYTGGESKYIFISFLLGLGFIGIAATQFEYIEKRVNVFLHSNIDSNQDDGWQNHQALIAVGGGGRIGKGYGKGLQKFGYIPEAQSDFIFAAFSEEIGFVGNVVLLGLYFFLIYSFLTKLSGVKDEYYKYLGVGILSLIIMQMFINIGVNIKLIPLTGLTLPFISHGGSALIVNMIELILLHKIVAEK